MKPIEIYVGFWPRQYDSIWSVFGHVEVWGYTEGNTFFFIDPRQPVTDIIVTHFYEEIEALLFERHSKCSEIWRLSEPGKLRVPMLGPFTCVTVVASIIGCRAYTFRGLRRKLRAIGAEKLQRKVIPDEEAQGRPGRQGGTPQGAQDLSA